jgi:hypothetical protein
MKTELALCLVLITGIILWHSGFIYSVEIAAVALILLALLYFPFGFYFFPVQGQHNLVFSVVAGSLLFMAPMSLLFGLLRFPATKLQAGIGSCVLPILILVIIMLFRSAPQEKRRYYRVQLLRTSIWLAIILFLLITFPLNMPTF